MRRLPESSESLKEETSGEDILFKVQTICKCSLKDYFTPAASILSTLTLFTAG